MTKAPSLDCAETALAAGDILLAIDIVRSAIERGDPHPRLRFIEVLALARLGDTEAALALHSKLADQEAEEVMALRGRLLKDRAAALPPGRRASAYAEASRAYRRAFQATGGYFSGINAAATARLAGRIDEARTLAERLLEEPALGTPTSYWAAATRAEAFVLLGRTEDARVALENAVAMADASPAARASTLRQFSLIGADARLIDALRPPPVLVWTGHMLADDGPALAPLEHAVGQALDRLGPHVGYGALAAGGDILVAEAMLARGAELQIVLPFARDDFIAQSVAPFPGWAARFDAVIARAAAITFATGHGYVGDPGQFAHGAAFALGAALLRADALATGVRGLALWDGKPATGVAGTAADVARLASADVDTAIVPVERFGTPLHREPHAPAAPREAASIIFTDFAGFSKLSEAALPLFWTEIMERIGEVLAGNRGAVRAANSWGDALYAVVSTPAEAATIALEIADRLASVDLDALDLPATAGMRIAVHHGPLYRILDPISGRENFIGGEVTQAARVEPITPPGQVYVTATFAALLRTCCDRSFATHYVGRVPLAKSFGTIPLYRLERRAGF